MKMPGSRRNNRRKDFQQIKDDNNEGDHEHGEHTESFISDSHHESHAEGDNDAEVVEEKTVGNRPQVKKELSSKQVSHHNVANDGKSAATGS